MSQLAYYTTREAAAKLGISLRTAQLWVESGILEAWKTNGGHRRISLDSVHRLMHGRSGAAEAAGVPQAGPAQVAPEPLKIVVVEDDPIFLRLYEGMIGRWPFPVALQLAEDGYKGLLLIGQTLPDMVITDLNMPGVDGFQLLRAILTDPALKQTRVVAVTAMGPEHWEKYGGLPEGITVFGKPIPFPQLQEIARELSVAKGLSTGVAAPAH